MLNKNIPGSCGPTCMLPSTITPLRLYSSVVSKKGCTANPYEDSFSHFVISRSFVSLFQVVWFVQLETTCRALVNSLCKVRISVLVYFCLVASSHVFTLPTTTSKHQICEVIGFIPSWEDIDRREFEQVDVPLYHPAVASRRRVPAPLHHGCASLVGPIMRQNSYQQQ